MISENENLQEFFLKKSQKMVSWCDKISENCFEISFYRCLRKKKVLMDLLYKKVVKNKNFIFELKSLNYYAKTAKFEIEILAKKRSKK